MQTAIGDKYGWFNVTSVHSFKTPTTTMDFMMLLREEWRAGQELVATLGTVLGAGLGPRLGTALLCEAIGASDGATTRHCAGV